MAKGETNLTDPNANLGNLSEKEMTTNQATVAIPLAAGEFKTALKWISPI